MSEHRSAGVTRAGGPVQKTSNMPDNMPPEANRIKIWVSALQEGSVWKRATMLGLSVGLFQAALNQGDYWVNHAVNASIVAKTIISPLITFSVALASAASTWVEKRVKAD